MSVFMLSGEFYGSLKSFVYDGEGSTKYTKGCIDKFLLHGLDIDMLIFANKMSCQARYGEKAYFLGIMEGRRWTLVDAIKGIECYLYQTSEAKCDYLNDALRELLSGLMSAYIHSLPEYEEAQWGS